MSVAEQLKKVDAREKGRMNTINEIFELSEEEARRWKRMKMKNTTITELG